MREENRAKRRDHILDVAVEVLAERGYRDANMLEVARRAKASKETLYSWFGDKRGLFEAVIRRNAASVQTVMADQLAADAPLEEALTAFGRALLTLLMGDGAVALNRAAIAEAASDRTLADTLLAQGRQATLPAFIRYLDGQAERGHLNLSAPEDAAEDFLGLLIGDLQIRRLLGAAGQPGQAQIETRAQVATEKFLKLYHPASAL
ncbi:MAG: TetR/AcrR family transcriptional regulator [Pseudomonadota bacterium]